MRNRILTAAAALAFAATQLACGGADPTSSEGQGTQEDGTQPSQDLTSAHVGGGAGGGAAGNAGPAITAQSGFSGESESETPGTGTGTGGAGGGTGTGGGAGGGGTGGGAVDPFAGSGPKPTTACTVSKDSAGFFTRSSTASSYVAYVPASYDGNSPMRVIVGLHGCGDDAKNFATWGVNPYDTRSTQNHIGISVGGADGRCWNSGDDAKILAAVDDLSKCFWVHQKKVVIAGFSSGGEISYRVGLSNASRFAGILIEDSGLYAANNNPDGLLASASWKINIAHLTHTSDPVFPLSNVKADWLKTKAAGFPLLTKETAGQHDGVSADWATWLIPQSASWTAP